ncbi:MAG: hypothetical protein WA971_00335 [Microbacterium sp.]
MEEPVPSAADAEDAPAHPPEHRRRRAAWIVTTGIVLIALVCGGVQLWANLAYDAAEQGFLAARDDAEPTTQTLRVAVDRAAEVRGSVAMLSGLSSPELIDDADRTVLQTESGALGAALTDTSDLLVDAPPLPEPKSIWPWAMFADGAALTTRTTGLRTLAADQESAARTVDDLVEEVVATGSSIADGAADAVPAIEAANIDARLDPILALRDAGASVRRNSSAFNVRTADTLQELDEAVAQVKASAAEELAKKSGPLGDSRRDAEAFARSLTPGILLEFIWEPIVNGYGSDGSMGGVTTWWWDEPYRASIELSDSVAERWPSDASRSLIAHEAGHAITQKCAGLTYTSPQEDFESWATAWAIGMGYADEANGVWAYGYPAQSYIDAAAGCR